MPIDTLRNVLRAELPGMPRLPRRIALKTVLGAFGGLVTVHGTERLAAGPEPAIFAFNHGTARSAAPVVPVGIHYPAGERLGRAPRLGRLELRVGEPLDFAAECAEALTTEGRARREVARRAVSRVMASLEELSGKTRLRQEPFRRLEPAGDRP